MKKNLHKKYHFICGKGGVGKSIYCCSLAKYFAQQSLKVLLVQINSLDSHSSFLSIDRVTENIQLPTSNIYTVMLRPQKCLREYFLLKIPSLMLSKLFFNSKAMKSLMNFIPGLSELSMLGKIWYLGQNQEHHYNFDKIIVDCPATGHGIYFLNVANVAADNIKTGPLVSQVASVVKMLKDKEQTSVHIVSLPKELPVNESIMLAKQINSKKLASLDNIVINCLKDEILHEMDKKELEKLTREASLKNLIKKTLHEESQQIFYKNKLKKALNKCNFLHLPFISGEINVKDIENLAKVIKKQSCINNHD